MPKQKSNNTKKDLQINIIRKQLDTIVLTFLREQPMYGYELMTKIQKTFGIHFGPSTIYPFLAQLEKNGLVKSKWNIEEKRPRKNYHITTKGQETLTATADTINLLYQKTYTNTTTDEE